MSKRKLFLDADNTITDSIKAFCESYNILYKDRPNFIPARWWEVQKWNFSDECPLLRNDDKKVNEIFESELFFKNLDFINGNTKEIIEKLCNKYEVVLVTIGTLRNIALKSMWLKENLPCIKEYIFLVNDGCKMDKSIVDMEGAIFMDDVSSNLNSSNAAIKICVGEEYSWNDDWDGLKLVNWTDIGDWLL